MCTDGESTYPSINSNISLFDKDGGKNNDVSPRYFEMIVSALLKSLRILSLIIKS